MIKKWWQQLWCSHTWNKHYEQRPWREVSWVCSKCEKVIYQHHHPLDGE